MNELEQIAVTIGEASYYIAGVTSMIDGDSDYPEIREKLDDARSDIALLGLSGRYIPICRIPVKDRLYSRTRADIESLLKAADVDLAEEANIAKDTAENIVYKNVDNDLFSCHCVANALGITLDELFWKLYKLVDRSES